MKQPHLKTPSRRTVLIASCVAVLAAGVAVPKIVGSFADTAVAKRAPAPAAPTAATSDGDAPADDAAPVDSAPAAPKPPVATSADGDLEPTVKLRWTEFESGDRVLGKLKLANHSPKDVWLPASGEPNQGLAVVVENADGDEVRRVVESAKGDQLPRRLVKLASGYEVELPLVVVAEDETPLPPGAYTVHAELRTDARFARLGLPGWKPTHGVVRSEKVPLVVTPAAPTK